MSIKQKYLVDEDKNIFSPIASISTICPKEHSSVVSNLSQYSELIFAGKTIDKEITAALSFTPYAIEISDFDKYNKFSSVLGKYYIPSYGYYSIYVRFKLRGISGNANLKRNIMLGVSQNGKSSDNGTSRWVQQEYDRCSASFSIELQCEEGDTIQFQYYCDGAINNKIEMSEIFIIKSEQYYIGDDESLGGGTTKVEYLKDENGEIFSPITKSDSIYFKTEYYDGVSRPKNYNELFGNCVRLAATTHRRNGTLSSVTGVTYLNSINWEAIYSEYINDDLLTKISDNGIPRYVAKQNGWYIVGITGRLEDAPDNIMDSTYYVTLNNEQIVVSAQRTSYRMGGSGAVCRYLYKGQIIDFGMWRDNPFTKIYHFNCYVKYCGDNF